MFLTKSLKHLRVRKIMSRRSVLYFCIGTLLAIGLNQTKNIRISDGILKIRLE